MDVEKKGKGLLQRAENLKNESDAAQKNEIKREGLLHKAELLAGRGEKIEEKQPESVNSAFTSQNFKSDFAERTPFIKINPFEKNPEKNFDKNTEKKIIETPSENKIEIKSEKNTEEQWEKPVKKTFEKQSVKSADFKNTNVSENQKKIKTPGKHKKMNRVLFKIIFLLFVILFFMAGLFFGYKRITSVSMKKNHAMVEKQLVLCQELISAKYQYSDVIIIKKSLAFAKSYSIVKYSGIIRVGIEDISDITYKVSKNGKTVTISLPQFKILGNELTSQEVFDESRSIFVPITTQEIFDEIEQAKNDAADNLLSQGILDEAKNYTVKIITQFMYSAGFEEVIVR